MAADATLDLGDDPGRVVDIADLDLDPGGPTARTPKKRWAWVISR